jgi:hypothetical protein
MAQRQLKGRPLDILDGLLAATAFHYRLTVVTRNVRDFPWVDHPHSKPFDEILDLQARMIARQGVRGVRTAECGVRADGEPGKGVVLRPAGDCRSMLKCEAPASATATVQGAGVAGGPLSASQPSVGFRG